MITILIEALVLVVVIDGIVVTVCAVEIVGKLQTIIELLKRRGAK